MEFKFKLNMLILDENVLVIVLIRQQAPFDRDPIKIRVNDKL